MLAVLYDESRNHLYHFRMGNITAKSLDLCQLFIIVLWFYASLQFKLLIYDFVVCLTISDNRANAFIKLNSSPLPLSLTLLLYCCCSSHSSQVSVGWMFVFFPNIFAVDWGGAKIKRWKRWGDICHQYESYSLTITHLIINFMGNTM